MWLYLAIQHKFGCVSSLGDPYILHTASYSSSLEGRGYIVHAYSCVQPGFTQQLWAPWGDIHLNLQYMTRYEPLNLFVKHLCQKLLVHQNIM